MTEPATPPLERSSWAGVPSTAVARTYIEGLAGDDCPWMLVDAALDEIDRLRAGATPLPVTESVTAALPASFDSMTPVDVVVQLAAGICDVPTPDGAGHALLDAVREAARLLGFQVATIPFGLDNECIFRLRAVGADPEVDAAAACVGALDSLDPEAQRRVVAYLADRAGVAP